jgi:hypothetical protein
MTRVTRLSENSPIVVIDYFGKSYIFDSKIDPFFRGTFSWKKLGITEYFDKKWFGLHFGDFSKAHPVTLFMASWFEFIFSRVTRPLAEKKFC